MLGSLLLFLAKHGEMKDVLRVLTRLMNKVDVVGVPPMESLEACFEKMLTEKTDSSMVQSSTVRYLRRNSNHREVRLFMRFFNFIFDQALVCYAHECTYPQARNLAMKLGEHFELNESHRLKVNTAIGK